MKQFEENLTVSEERLLTLINATPDIICFKDGKGRWMLANYSILDLYRLKGVDYVGKSEFELADFTAPIYRDAFLNCQGSDDLAWEQGTSYRTVENIPEANGKMHVFDVFKVPLFYPDGSRKGIVVFGRDISEIKKTESALRESEDKFRGFFMNSPIGISEVDLSLIKSKLDEWKLSGIDIIEHLKNRSADIGLLAPMVRIIDLNQTSLEILRTTDQKSFEHNIGYYFNEESFSTLRNMLIALAEGKTSYSGEIPIMTDSGLRYLNFGMAIQPGYENSWERVLASFADITQRKLAEEKLALIAGFQSRLLKLNGLREIHELVAGKVHDLIGDGIVFTTNINSEKESGKIVAIKGLDIPNTKLTQAIGLDPVNLEFYLKDITEDELKIYRSGKFEEMTGGLYTIAARRFPKVVMNAVEKLLRIKRIYTNGFVYHDLHLGGVVILARGDLSSYGDTIELIVNQAAISINRLKAEASMKEAEERFRLAFQTSPDSININTLETGEYVEVNEGFCSLTGYRREEVIGKSSTELSIWADPGDRKRMVDLLKKEGKVANFEAVFLNKDGTNHTALMSAALINLNGVSNILSITRDIEEIKKAERAILSAKEAAEEASRLKTAFLNNISHEVRTPMNAIMGFTELLQADEVSATEKDRYFGIINSNAKQLLSIIDDVLEISRMDSGRIPLNPGAFSLNELMDDIQLSMNDMVARKGLSLLYSLGEKGNSDHVSGDREKIRQIITGLIGNAMKFTPQGTISFGYLKKEKVIEFFVKDTGIGIASEEHEKIFERFYQVNNDSAQSVRGAGLGLSIARGLAEVMGGEIRVKSAPGEGSVFYLSIPYNDYVSSHPGQSQKKPLMLEELTILVAEDEDYNFELLYVLLSKHSKHVIRAKNGAEVLSILEKQKPDLILMDLKMPVMNGYEATRLAKKLYPDLCIIALTAYTQQEEEHHALNAGCSAFISKPIRRQELMETIRRSLGK